ncbi:hypothetical protein [Egbenema bharatensis]|uniref:hypothetical protein n=1 Tax=Egbenema bharatensis TaxID=3463334 RepID=UPI003A8718B1
MIAGTTLPRRRAIVTATIVCFAWGLVLLAGTLMVTTLAGYKPLFSKGAIAHHYLRLTGMFIGGFILFELVILGAGFLLENQCVLTVPILWSIFINNAVWLGFLTLAHACLVWDRIRSGHHRSFSDSTTSAS